MIKPDADPQHNKYFQTLGERKLLKRGPRCIWNEKGKCRNGEQLWAQRKVSGSRFGV